MVFLEDDNAFFRRSRRHSFKVVALEISDPPSLLPGKNFPDRTAIVAGNKRTGFSSDFPDRSVSVVTIPQFGDVESLNLSLIHI